MKKIKRAASAVLSAVIAAGMIILPPPDKFSGLTKAVFAAEYNTTDSLQNGAVLDCWGWSFAEIENNLEDIQDAGFSAIQTSPIQLTQTSSSNTFADYELLNEPLGFSIDTTGSSPLGSKSDFESLCKAADELEIKVIVNVIANNLCDKDSLTEELKNSSDFWHSSADNVTDYTSRENITQNRLKGLPDLNTGNESVQTAVLNYLKECIDTGADGFCFKNAKYIETPSDGESFASDFWDVVINGAKEYASENYGIDLYCYGEISGDTDESESPLSLSAYTAYMSITDDEYGTNIRDNVINAGSASSFGSDYKKAETDGSILVLWAESEEDYAEGVSSGISVDDINKAYALIAARADSMSVYLARPSSMDSALGSAGTSDWNSTAVSESNKFNNYFEGKSETLSYSGNIAYVERGTAGVLLVNCSGEGTSVSVPANSIATGTYTDQISGNTFTVSGDIISGKIGSSGIAVVYNVISCPHKTHNINGICTVCGSAVGHSYGSDNICTVCGFECTHTSHDANGYCKECKTYVGHTYDENYVCTVCGAEKYQKTVYFDNSTTNWDSVYIYSWDEADYQCVGNWPGTQVTETTSDGLYVYTLPTSAQYVIFNSGTGTQTGDLDITRCGVYTLDGFTGIKHVYSEGTCTGCGENLSSLYKTEITGVSESSSYNIGISLYASLSEQAAEDESTYMCYTLNGSETKVYASEADTAEIDEALYYIFPLSIAPKEMTDTITAQLITADGEGEAYTYTVKELAEETLESSDDESYKTLLKAMLNYGGYTQLYFDYNTVSPANKDIDNTITSASVEADETGTISGTLPDGIEYGGSTLVLNSSISVQHYFKVSEGTDISGYSLTQAETSGNETSYKFYYYESEPFSLTDLGKTDTCTIGECTISYSPLTYLKEMYENGSDSLKPLCLALYDYYKAAVDYSEGGI